jgi:hypothetical protein
MYLAVAVATRPSIELSLVSALPSEMNPTRSGVPVAVLVGPRSPLPDDPDEAAVVFEPPAVVDELFSLELEQEAANSSVAATAAKVTRQRVVTAEKDRPVVRCMHSPWSER